MPFTNCSSMHLLILFCCLGVSVNICTFLWYLEFWCHSLPSQSTREVRVGGSWSLNHRSCRIWFWRVTYAYLQKRHKKNLLFLFLFFIFILIIDTISCKFEVTERLWMTGKFSNGTQIISPVGHCLAQYWPKFYNLMALNVYENLCQRFLQFCFLVN